MVANKAGFARFLGRFRLNWPGHGKPARERTQRAAARRRGIRGIEDHAVSGHQGRQRAPAYRLRHRRDPRESVHERSRAAPRPRERRRDLPAAAARRFRRQNRRDPPDRRRCVAARPNASCWSGSGRNPPSGARPTAGPCSPPRNGWRRAGIANAASWLAADPCRDSTSYYAVRHAVESVGNALYRMPDLKTAKKPPQPKLARFGIAVPDADAADAERGSRDGRGIAAGTALHEGPRQPAGERLHAPLSRRRRAHAREGAQERARTRARRARDQAPRHGLVPLGDARLGRAAAAHRARVQGGKKARRPSRWSARASLSTPAASRSSSRRAWTR